jgi:hypothetical protein
MFIFCNRKRIFKMNNNLVTHNEMSKCPLTCFKNSEKHAKANAQIISMFFNLLFLSRDRYSICYLNKR